MSLGDGGQGVGGFDGDRYSDSLGYAHFGVSQKK
jgi:hypothetical protein